MEDSKEEKISEEMPKISSSPGENDSLADFKSPKAERPVVQVTSKIKILNSKRATKKSSKKDSSKSSNNKKPGSSSSHLDGRTNQSQPSIESSFFKAAIGNKEGHTCPLCLKYFADTNAGTAHSKNCATKHNVSTRKLLAAVALQERQASERMAIGLPAGPFVQPKDKTPRRIREPAQKSDPDLQLALALSKSLQENEMEQELEEAFLLAAEHRGEEPIVEMTCSQKRKTLQSFGFSTDKPATAEVLDGPGRTRRKKHLGPTVLQTRTKESRDRILSERIAEILMGNDAITQISQPPISEDVSSEKSTPAPRSRLLKKIHRTTSRLWDSAQLSSATTNFYVETLYSLVKPVVEQENGSETKLDDQKSSENPKESLSKIAENIPTENVDQKVNCAEEMMKYPVAVETRNIHVTDRQYRNSLPADWSNILNVSSVSDVVVLLNDEKHIWAHKLVFHVRCSDILLDCEPHESERFSHVKEQVNWPDVDFSTGLAFLEFVYSGVIEKNVCVLDDNRLTAGVRRLARKYRLKDLFDYLRKRKAEINMCRSVESTTVDVADTKIKMDNLERVSDIIKKKLSDTVDNNDAQDNVIFENHGQENSGNEDTEDSVLRLSPCQELFELSVRKSNDSVRKNNEAVETMKSKSASIGLDRTMSPDLFNETIQKMDEDVENSEASNVEMTQLSSEDNSNLRALAELIADDTSSDRNSQELTPATSPIKSTIENESPSRIAMAEPIESSQINQAENEELILFDSTKDEIPENISDDYNEISIRKSIGTTTLSEENVRETPKMDELPESESLEKESRSKLSLFIEKVQRINSKPALDSYCEEDTLGGVVDRRRFGNPFNVNAASNQSTPIFKATTKYPVDEDSSFNREKGESVKGKSNSSIEKSVDTKENSPKDNEESSFLDDTINTDDEDISMYSKYKRTNEQNSIMNYREILKQLTSENNTTKDEAIDLTQESDEEFEMANDLPSTPVRPRDFHSLSTDSNNSSPVRSNFPIKVTAIVEHNDSDVENCVKDDRASSLSPVVEQSTRKEGNSSEKNVDIVSKNREKSLDTTKLDVSDIDDEIFGKEHRNQRSSSPLNCSDQSTCSQPKRKSDESDHQKNEANSDHITIESSQETKSSRNSLEFFNFNVTENKNSQLSRTPSPRFDSSEKFRSRQRKSDESRRLSLIEDLEFENTLVEERKTMSSPEYPYFSKTNDEEIFNHGVKSSNISNNSSRKRSSCESKKYKKHSHGEWSENLSLNDLREGQCGSRELSPVAGCSRISASNRDFDILEMNDQVFTQSFGNQDEAPKSLSPLTSRDTPRASSPIFISSSPEVDNAFEGHFESRNSNKENSVERNESPVHFGSSGDYAMERFSPPYFEELPFINKSPMRPLDSSPSYDQNLVNSVRKFQARSISMPTSSTTNSDKNRKKPRTPKKSSRLTMSQELSPVKNFNVMDTPELKKELDKFGLKPQSRKRARQLLNHIYNELHIEASQAGSTENHVEGSDDEECRPKKIGRISHCASDDSESDDIPLSQQSNTSHEYVIPEEMEYPDANTSPKKMSDSISLKEAFIELMKVDKNLHRMVLTYEPLPLEILRSTLRSQGFKCNQNELMDFLDEECITFQVLAQLKQTRTKKTGSKKFSKQK